MKILLLFNLYNSIKNSIRIEKPYRGKSSRVVILRFNGDICSGIMLEQDVLLTMYNCLIFKKKEELKNSIFKNF